MTNLTKVFAALRMTRQNEILRWAQDDKAAVFRTTGRCHSEAGFMGEESGVKAFQEQGQILRWRSE